MIDLSLPVELFRIAVLKHRRPISVNLEITYRCNSNCKYCPNEKFNEKDSQEIKKEMSTQQILSMIDELSRIGMKRLAIGGGEPLLRNDLGEIIRYAKRKNLILFLSTNGILVPKKIKDLEKLDVLFISLDGPEEVHDKYRGKGSFKKAIEAIKVAKDNGINTIINTVITKDTYGNIDFLLEKAEEMEFDIVFSPLNFSHPIKESKPCSPSQEEYHKIINRLILEKKKGKPIINSLAFFMFLDGWPGYKNRCWGGRSFCTIDAYGNVCPCYVFHESKKMVSGVENSFVNAFRQLPIHKCANCSFYGPVEFNLSMSLNPSSIINSYKLLTKNIIN